MKFPMQPISKDEHGALRFVKNRIVDDLLAYSLRNGFGLNEIAIRAAKGEYTKEEQMQLAQLIGYSVYGYGTLSYVSDESYDQCRERIETDLKEKY